MENKQLYFIQEALQNDVDSSHKMNATPQNQHRYSVGGTKRTSDDGLTNQIVEDCASSLSSDQKISLQHQFHEDKKDIYLPSSDHIFQTKFYHRRNTANGQKDATSTSQKRTTNDGEHHFLGSGGEDNPINPQKVHGQQRKSLLVKQVSPNTFDEHNIIVLRKTIRQLTKKGVMLKDQEEQKLVEEQDEKSIINPVFAEKKLSFKEQRKSSIKESADKTAANQVKETTLHQKVRLFLKSKKYNTFFVFLSILNLLAFMIDDYSERKPHSTGENTVRKDASETIQLVCSLVFVADIILSVYRCGIWRTKNPYFKNPWHIFNFLSVISSVIVSFNGLPNSISILLRVVGMLRPLKLIYHIKPYKKQLERFIRSVSLLGESIIRLFIFMIFFTILGLNIFRGAMEYRCRTTPEPPTDSTIWEVAEDVPFLCGYWTCPADSYCRAPLDYDFPYDHMESDIPEMAFGFVNFDNFFKAMLTIIHLTFIQNWSKITYMYWRYVNTLFVSAYFTAACIFLFHILINMILAIFYDSFQLQKGIKNFKEYKLIVAQKQEQKNMIKLKNLEEEMSKIIKEKEVQTKKLDQQQLNSENNQSGITKTKALLRQITKKINTMRVFQKKGSSQVEQSQQMSMSINEEKANNQQEQQQQLQEERSENAEELSLPIRIYISFFYQFIVQSYILISIILICLDKFPISETESTVVNIMQLILNIFFILEVAFKLFVFRKQYFYSWHNNIDLIVLVVISSINIYYLYRLCSGQENPLESENLRNLQTVKSIEILRIFQLIVYSPLLNTVEYLIEIFMKSIIRLSYYFLIIIAYCILFSLIGNYLFAFTAYYDADDNIDFANGTSPRINFDSFLDSFEAIMLIILNDEWAESMYSYMRVLGQYVAIFWVIVDFTGDMLVMNLLRALFIKTYLKYLYNSNATIKEPMHKMESLFKKFHKFGEMQTPLPTHRTSKLHVESNLLKKISMFKFQFFESALYDKLVGHCKKIEQSQHFINTLILMTVANTALLAAQSRLDNPDSSYIKSLRYLEMITMIIYLIEAMIKIISRGFLLNGPNSYLRQSKNIFDLFLLITQMLSLLVYPDYVIFRTLRTLNLLHLSKYFVGVRVMLSSLTQSVMTILKLLLFTLVFLIVFAIIPMKQLKGKLFYCTSLDGNILATVDTKQDCLDLGGDWINNQQNWDNMLFSLFNLFIMASCEGWSIIMGYANNARGVDQNPSPHQHKYWSVYFIVYIILGNIMLFNAFTGVMIEKYIDIKKKFALQQEIIHVKDATKLKKEVKISLDIAQIEEAGDEVVEWMEIKKSIYETRAPKTYSRPTKESDYVRHHLFQLIYHKYFKLAMDSCIILNTICFSLQYQRQPTYYQEVLDSFNYVFLVIFICEIALKVYLERSIFFMKRFQIFELIMAVLSFAYLIVQGTVKMSVLRKEHREILLCLEFISVFRVLRLAKTIQIVQKTLNILFYILPEIAPVAGLLLYLIYMYALIGMQIFPFIKVQETLNGYDCHFKTFNTAVFTLVRVASGEQWFLIVNDAVRQQQPNFVCQDISDYNDFVQNGLNGCGTLWGYIYFFSFHLFVSVIILNLFIAVLLELIIGQNSAMSKYQLSKIKDLWSEYDKDGFGFINYEDFWKFTSRIALIYGVDKADLINPIQKKNFLRFLQLPLYTHKNREGKSYFGFRFHDVVVQMTQVSLFLRFGIFPGGPIENSDRIVQFYKELDEKNQFVAQKSDLKSGDIAVIVIIQRRIKNWMKRGQELYNAKQKSPAKYQDMLNEFHSSYRSINLNNVIKNSSRLGQEEDEQQSIFKKQMQLQQPGQVPILSNFSNINIFSERKNMMSSEEEGSSQFSEHQIQEAPQLTNKLVDSITSHDFNKIYSNKFEAMSQKQKNIEASYKNYTSIIASKDSNVNIINYYNITNNYYQTNNNVKKLFNNNSNAASNANGTNNNNNNSNIVTNNSPNNNNNILQSEIINSSTKTNNTTVLAKKD